VNAHPIFQVLARTLDVFEMVKVPCAVMGGFAVRHWGLPRPTYDVDFAVGVEGEALVRLLSAFDEAGFTVPTQFLTGFTDTLAGMRKVAVSCFESGTVWNVDIFLANTVFVRSALERRIASRIEGHDVAVVSPEDLLHFKLLTNRAKDRADVEDLLFVVGPLDLLYLLGWAPRLGVQALLEEVLRDAGRA